MICMYVMKMPKLMETENSFVFFYLNHIISKKINE